MPLGLFIMALVPLRRLVMKGIVSINLVQMAVVGAVVGFLTGLFLSTGPLVCRPFWRSASCAATASLIVQMAKIVSFHEFGAISMQDLARGRRSDWRSCSAPSPSVRLWPASETIIFVP